MFLIHNHSVLCGRWESYPREFAKCRRCRKAKYCGKECQSTAWSEGHRFWCSAKDGDEDTADPIDHQSEVINTVVAVELSATAPVTMTAGGTVTGRAERRAERERERHARERALSTVTPGAELIQATRVAAFRNAHNGHATATAGNYSSRTTATAANRPLLAPQPWASRSTQTLPRSADRISNIGLPPPVHRANINHHGRLPAVNLDQELSTGRRASGMTANSSNISSTSRYISAATENAIDEDVRGHRRGDDDDMSLD